MANTALLSRGPGFVMSPPANRGEVFPTDSTVYYWVQLNQTDNVPAIISLPNTFTSDSCSVTKYEYLNGVNGACVFYMKELMAVMRALAGRKGISFPIVPFVLGNQNGDIQMAEEVWDFFKNKGRL